MSASTRAASSPWREPPAVHSVLAAAGLVSHSEFARAAVRDVSRSHGVARVDLRDGRGYIVKSLREQSHSSGRSLVAECFVYRLASWNPDLAALVPKCAYVDERRQVVVLDAAPADHVLTGLALTAGFPRTEFATQLGRTLGRLHVATSELPAVTTANCGVFGLPDTPAAERRLGDDSPAGTRAIAMICADADIAASLRRMAQEQRPSCLIHGDVKWDNVIMDPGPPAAISLFDWELSGFGDPAWDLGCALADGMALAVRHGLPAGQPCDWIGESERALLAAYAGATPVEAGFPRRVAGSWCARLAHLAMECAAGIGDAEHETVKWLLFLSNSMARHEDAVGAVIADGLGARS